VKTKVQPREAEVWGETVCGEYQLSGLQAAHTALSEGVTLK